MGNWGNGGAGRRLCCCPGDAIYNNVGNCVGGVEIQRGWFFMGNKKRPDPWIRTQDTRYHPTFARVLWTTGALTADDAQLSKGRTAWGEIGALDNGSTRLFLRIGWFPRVLRHTCGVETPFHKSGSGTTSTNTAKALHRPASLCAQWLRVLRPINAMWI